MKRQYHEGIPEFLLNGSGVVETCRHCHATRRRAMGRSGIVKCYTRWFLAGRYVPYCDGWKAEK